MDENISKVNFETKFEANFEYWRLALDFRENVHILGI